MFTISVVKELLCQRWAPTKKPQRLWLLGLASLAFEELVFTFPCTPPQAPLSVHTDHTMRQRLVALLLMRFQSWSLQSNCS